MIHSGERKGVYDSVEDPAEQEGVRNRVTSGRVPAESGNTYNAVLIH